MPSLPSRLFKRSLAALSVAALTATLTIASPDAARAEATLVGAVVTLATLGIIRHETQRKRAVKAHPYCGQYPDGRHYMCTHPTHIMLVPARCRVDSPHGVAYDVYCMNKHGYSNYHR